MVGGSLSYKAIITGDVVVNFFFITVPPGLPRDQNKASM